MRLPTFDADPPCKLLILGIGVGQFSMPIYSLDPERMAAADIRVQLMVLKSGERIRYTIVTAAGNDPDSLTPLILEVKII